MYGPSQQSKLCFEKRVIGASAKLHRDPALPRRRSDSTVPSIRSHRMSNSCVSSAAMEMLTPDMPLCYENLSPSKANKSHSRGVSSSSFMLCRSGSYLGNDSVVEIMQPDTPVRTSREKLGCVSFDQPAEPLHFSSSQPSIGVRQHTSTSENQSNGCVNRGKVAKKLELCHDKVPDNLDEGGDDGVDSKGSKGSFRWHMSTGGVTQSSVSRSRESTEKGLMRVNLAHKALIGKGSYGVVFKAMDLDTNHFIAVKEIALCRTNDENNIVRKRAIDAVRSEIALMKQLDHPHIVKCLGEECDEKDLRIYLEYVSGGSISNVLHTFGPFQEKQTAIYTRQMLEGLSYLHSKNIVHRDLKGDNLLVDTHGVLKISDFGTAKELLDQSIAASIVGTAYFMAPEVILGQDACLASDIWSVGCCVIEMLTGHPPFSEVKNQYALMMRVAEYKGELFHDMLPKEHTFSREAVAFLEKCLLRDPTKRPTARELLEHPWLDGLLSPSCSESHPRVPKPEVSLKTNSEEVKQRSKMNGSSSNASSTKVKNGSSTCAFPYSNPTKILDIKITQMSMSKNVRRLDNASKRKTSGA